MELIDSYEYSRLLESWYKDTYGVEYNAYDSELLYATKMEMSLGYTFEGTTVDDEYIRLDITDKKKFFLGKIKYGYSTFSEESYCEV
jgi:hypothetical protein